MIGLICRIVMAALILVLAVSQSHAEATPGVEGPQRLNTRVGLAAANAFLTAVNAIQLSTQESMVAAGALGVATGVASVWVESSVDEQSWATSLGAVSATIGFLNLMMSLKPHDGASDPSAEASRSVSIESTPGYLGAVLKVSF